MSELAQTLDTALAARLREVVEGRRPTTETELRELSDKVSGWTRALQAQVHGSERRLAELGADPTSEFAEVAAELRRVEKRTGVLEDWQSLADGLDARTRELRSKWLLS